MAGLTNAQILLVRNLADWTGLPDQLRLLARAVVQEDKTTKNSRLTCNGFPPWWDLVSVCAPHGSS